MSTASVKIDLASQTLAGNEDAVVAALLDAGLGVSADLAKLIAPSATIATASVLGLEDLTARVSDITGTSAINAVQLADGHVHLDRVTEGHSYSYSSTLLTPGSVELVTSAGDWLLFVGLPASVVAVIPIPRRAVWGAIPGTLADQADLQAALDALAMADTMVRQYAHTADYTLVLADAGSHHYHPESDDNARTFTIDSNANVPWPVGTALTFVNDKNVLTIAITDDVLVLAGGTSTGARTLATTGLATALKVTATRWVISGSGLS